MKKREKFYYDKKIELKLNEKEKTMLENIAESLMIESDEEKKNESEVVRIAIEIACKNKHLLNKDLVDYYFEEENIKEKDVFDIELFTNDIHSQGSLRTELLLYFKFGWMSLQRGMKLELVDDNTLKFYITSTNTFEVDKRIIESVNIYDNNECRELGNHSYENRITDVKRYCYLLKFYKFENDEV